MAATATQAAPAAKLERGISLPCPCCGEDTSITLNLGDIDGEDSLHCTDCDTSFDLARIRNLFVRWSPVLAWIDTMPSDTK